MEKHLVFEDVVKESEKLVLIDFYADWCGPCKMMNPMLEELTLEMQDELEIIKVNVDENLDAVAKYKILGVPTFLLFIKGEIVWQQPGVLTKKQLLDVLHQYL